MVVSIPSLAVSEQNTVVLTWSWLFYSSFKVEKTLVSKQTLLEFSIVPSNKRRNIYYYWPAKLSRRNDLEKLFSHLPLQVPNDHTH